MPSFANEFCCERVWKGSGGWRPGYADCTRRAAVEREGRLYCRQHDPEAKEKRRQAAEARWRADADDQARLILIADAGHKIIAVARLAARQQASWDDVADAVAALEALHSRPAND